MKGFLIQSTALDWAADTMASKPVVAGFVSTFVSIEPVSRQKHEVLYSLLVDGCIDSVEQHQQMARQSKINTDGGNLTPDLKQPGFCASLLFLPDSRLRH